MPATRRSSIIAVAVVYTLAGQSAFATITGTGQVSPSITNTNAWTAAGVIVGNTAAGSLTVNGGSDITATAVASTTEPAIILGYAASGVGTLNLSGSGSTITTNGLAAGYRGAGNLSVSSGAVINNTGDMYVAGFVVNSGVPNSNLAITGGGRVNVSKHFAMNFPLPSPNVTTYQFDLSSGGVLDVNTSFYLSGASTFNSAYGRARITGTGSKLDVAQNATIGDIGKLAFEMSGGASLVTGSFLDIGYQGETQFSIANATINANALTVASYSGFTNFTMGSGAVVNVTNYSQLGNGGRTTMELSFSAKFDSAGDITIGGSNSSGSIVSIVGSGPTFRSNNRLVVGGTQTTRRGVLGLTGGALAEGRTGVLIDRGGLVTGTGTLWSPNGSMTVDGVLQTIPNLSLAPEDTSLHLKPGASSSFISGSGSLQPQYNIANGALRIGKLTIDSNRLQLGGTLDLMKQENSAAATTATMYSPQVIIDATASGASYTGKFASFPQAKIDADSSWVLSYESRTVTIQRVRAGDATLDRRVNFDDLIPLAQNYNTTNRTWTQGDFTGDGRVNFDDLIILAQHYQGAATAGLEAGSFAADWALAQSLVPEPTSLMAVGMAAVGIVRRRRHGA